MYMATMQPHLSEPPRTTRHEALGKCTAELHRNNALLRDMIPMLVSHGRTKKIALVEEQIRENTRVIKLCPGEH